MVYQILQDGAVGVVKSASTAAAQPAVSNEGVYILKDTSLCGKLSSMGEVLGLETFDSNSGQLLMVLHMDDESCM